MINLPRELQKVIKSELSSAARALVAFDTTKAQGIEEAFVELAASLAIVFHNGTGVGEVKPVKKAVKKAKKTKKVVSND